MKILYLHETALLSGAENSLLNLVANLDKDKFEVLFACPPKGAFVDKLSSLGIKAYPVDFPSVRRLTGLRATIGKVRNIIMEDKVSLIHSNSIRTHIYAWLAGRPEKIPIVWHERNLIEREIIDPDRALASLPDAIICNSNAIAKRFIRKGRLPGKVHIIHNGVDVERFNPLIKGDGIRKRFDIGDEEIVIGIASRFNQNKGHEIFLSAASNLLKEVPGGRLKLKFLIAGGAVFEEDMNRETRLKAFAREADMGDRVIFTGFVNDMPEIYAATDIFVLASFAEPCGRVIAEAMACGKPVVGTNIGGTPEMVADGITGLLVRPGDAPAMAGAIRMLVEDKDRRLAMGREARIKAEKEFDIKAHAKKTGDLYSHILKLRKWGV